MEGLEKYLVMTFHIHFSKFNLQLILGSAKMIIVLCLEIPIVQTNLLLYDCIHQTKISMLKPNLFL